MAHPTIDLLQAPPTDCPLPAYNSIKYCFKSSDYQTVVGTQATFSIELNNANLNIIAPQLNYFSVAGVSFNVGTANTYNTLDTSAAYTKAEFAANLKAMFESNDYFFQRFTFAVVGDALVATAKEKKVQLNWTFDYSNFNPGNPVTTSQTNGTVDQYRPNYRLVLQIWSCPLDVVTDLISEEAYQVNNEGELCINIGKKVAPLLSTRFVHDLPTNSAWYVDEQIVKRFIVRYGESYADAALSCSTEARTFAFTDCIRIYNAAFQRDEAVVKNDIVCTPEFMTNTPQFSQLCEDSIAYLWINLWDVFDTPEPSGIRTHPYIDFFYTDGTTDSLLSTQFSISPEENKIYAVAAGWNTWKSFADPNKKVSYWRIRIVVENSNTVPTTQTFYASQYFKLVSCCEGDVEFIFLNEYGAYDTILFTQLDAIAFQSSNAVFESFLDDEEQDSLRGGQDVIDQFSNDVYTVTSKFVDDYKSIAWLKEFLKSTSKYVRLSVDGQSKKINKVLVQVDGVEYAKTDDNSIYLRLSYRINEDLNTQRN